MKGVVFTEFLDLVESNYGMEVADRVLTKGFPNDTGFTSVGTYDHRILISLIMEFSDAIGKSPQDVVFIFGKHLFHRLREIYPESTNGVNSSIDLVLKVEAVIHDEVLKLYPDAEVPSFAFPASPDGTFQVEYLSARPFADLAEGLLQGCIEHFGDKLQLERTDLEGEPGTHALFRFRPLPVT